MTPYLNRIKDFVSHWFPTRISPFGYFLIVLQFYYLYEVFVTDDVGGFSFTWLTLFQIMFSMGTVLLFFQLISTLFSWNRFACVIANFVALSIYVVIVAYQFGANELLDWSLISDNLSIAFSTESLSVIINSLDMYALAFIPKFIFVFLIFEIWKQAVSKSRQFAPILPKICATIGLYLILIVLPFATLDPILNFSKSIYFNLQPDFIAKTMSYDDPPPTLFSGNQYRTRPAHTKQPHVFLIVVESLNASALNKTNSQGQEWTPFLNSLQKKSVYIPRFYANSVQTAKGHFSLLFSVIPSISGKVFTKYPDLQVQSIASVLNTVGYDTIFFAAHDNPDFDNTHAFLEMHGFDAMVVEPYLKPEDDVFRLQWGVEDRVFYQRYFDYFDQTKEAQMNRFKPQFVVLSTISNHFPFSSVPQKRRFVYPDPETFEQRYANSVFLVDLGIQHFFSLLEQRGLLDESIVIITGDHSFPMGEHGNFHLESGYHEESFKVPFFLVWNDELKQQRIERPYSQLDIVPTLLDLLSVHVEKHQFQGVSIFDSRVLSHPIFLVQPYGKHLSVIDFPYKYRYYTKTRQEHVVHLTNDPLETTNIIDTISSERLENFRSYLKQIYYNQYAIEKNKFWPE